MVPYVGSFGRIGPQHRFRTITVVGGLRGVALSIGSAGSILSIGSAGSILSVGSAGSILSLGSAGTISGTGRPDGFDGRRLGALLAWTAIVAALLDR